MAGSGFDPSAAHTAGEFQFPTHPEPEAITKLYARVCVFMCLSHPRQETDRVCSVLKTLTLHGNLTASRVCMSVDHTMAIHRLPSRSPNPCWHPECDGSQRRTDSPNRITTSVVSLRSCSGDGAVVVVYMHMAYHRGQNAVRLRACIFSCVRIEVICLCVSVCCQHTQRCVSVPHSFAFFLHAFFSSNHHFGAHTMALRVDSVE